MQGKMCKIFPNHVPAEKRIDDDRETENHMCSINSVCSMFIHFLDEGVSLMQIECWHGTLIKYSFQTPGYLQLYQEMASFALEPATALLDCLLEGRGVSVEADDLRYNCVTHPT